MFAWLVVCRYTGGMAFELSSGSGQATGRAEGPCGDMVVPGDLATVRWLGDHATAIEDSDQMIVRWRRAFERVGHRLGHGCSTPDIKAQAARRSHLMELGRREVKLGLGDLRAKPALDGTHQEGAVWWAWATKPPGGVDVDQVREVPRAWRSDTWRTAAGLVCSLQNHHRRAVSRLHQKPWAKGSRRRTCGDIARLASKRS